MAADHSIVLTTCEPASYLDAYRFMKNALYLKLNRLFSLESRYDMRKDPELVRLIAESTMAVTSFAPFLVINKSLFNAEARQLVERLQDVARRRCSIWAKYVGNITYQKEIAASARNMVPVVARYPDGPLSREMEKIVQNVTFAVSF